MNIYLQYIITGAAVATFVGIAFAQFRRGNRTESGEIIDFYKKQAIDYKAMLDTTRTEYTKKFEDLTRELGELRGQYNAEKSQREQYEAILKDKNPETQKFMELVIKSCDDQARVNIEQGKINKQVVEALTTMGGVLADIHKMSKAEHDRDLNIVATVTKS